MLLPRRSGLALLKALRRRHPDVATVLMTGRRDIEEAAKAVRWEAFDFLLKPVRRAELLSTLERARRLRRIRTEMRSYTQELENLVRDELTEMVELGRGIEEANRRFTAVREHMSAAAGLLQLPRDEKIGGRTPGEMLRETFESLGRLAGEGQEALNATLGQWPSRDVPLGEILGETRRRIGPRLEEAGLDFALDCAPDLASWPVSGPHIGRVLRVLILRGIDEAAGRGAGSLRVLARETKGRLLLAVEFPTGRPAPSPGTVTWSPSPWVRRRILWSGLARVAAHARAAGARLYVDGSRPGSVRWALRVPSRVARPADLPEAA
jgi:CheY-like chemotaxis protein